MRIFFLIMAVGFISCRNLSDGSDVSTAVGDSKNDQASKEHVIQCVGDEDGGNWRFVANITCSGVKKHNVRTDNSEMTFRVEELSQAVFFSEQAIDVGANKNETAQLKLTLTATKSDEYFSVEIFDSGRRILASAESDSGYDDTLKLKNDDKKIDIQCHVTRELDYRSCPLKRGRRV